MMERASISKLNCRILVLYGIGVFGGLFTGHNGWSESSMRRSHFTLVLPSQPGSSSACGSPARADRFAVLRINNHGIVPAFLYRNAARHHRASEPSAQEPAGFWLHAYFAERVIALRLSIRSGWSIRKSPGERFFYPLKLPEHSRKQILIRRKAFQICQFEDHGFIYHVSVVRIYGGQ